MNYSHNNMVFPWLTIIEKYRKEGESNRHFAGRMGCNHAIIKEWRGGKIPSQKTINKIRDNVNMSFEDYKELTYVCHNVIPADIEREPADKLDESLDASNLPWTFFCRRLFSLKEKGQGVRTFLEELGISTSRWRELLKEKAPQLRLEEMSTILTHPKVANKDQVMVMILMGTTSPTPTDSLDAVSDSSKPRLASPKRSKR